MANEIERGKRMLREYLNSVSMMSVKSERRLFRLIENEYRVRMENPEYFEIVSSFLNRRKPRAEKEAFCFQMVREILLNSDIRGKMYELYPDEYDGWKQRNERRSDNPR